MSAQEIVLFESSDGAVTLPVEVDHARNAFNEKELVEGSNMHFLHFAFFANCCFRQAVAFYVLNVIMSVGYRVKLQRGVEFRQWATDVLRRYNIATMRCHLANSRNIRYHIHVHPSKISCPIERNE